MHVFFGILNKLTIFVLLKFSLKADFWSIGLLPL